MTTLNQKVPFLVSIEYFYEDVTVMAIANIELGVVNSFLIIFIVITSCIDHVRIMCLKS